MLFFAEKDVPAKTKSRASPATFHRNGIRVYLSLLPASRWRPIRLDCTKAPERINAAFR
jgi:hypothetical protein